MVDYSDDRPESYSRADPWREWAERLMSDLGYANPWGPWSDVQMRVRIEQAARRGGGES